MLPDFHPPLPPIFAPQLKYMNTSDWIGTVGVGLILLAYFCSTFKWLPANSKSFFLMNAIGAGLACSASYLITYWPFVILEGTWTVVSIVGWIRAKQ